MLVAEGGGSRGLDVTLAFHEKSPDYDEAPVNLTQTLQAGELQTGQSLGFALDLPENALPGHRSEHGELYWELDVKSDEMGLDTHVRRRIEVVVSAGPEEEDIFAGSFEDEG